MIGQRIEQHLIMSQLSDTDCSVNDKHTVKPDVKQIISLYFGRSDEEMNVM